MRRKLGLAWHTQQEQLMHFLYQVESSMLPANDFAFKHPTTLPMLYRFLVLDNRVISVRGE